MPNPPPNVATTLPSGTLNDRGGLVAALAFIEGVGVGSMGPREIRKWIDAYLVRPGRIDKPTHLTEPMAGTLLLDALVGPDASTSRTQLDRILGRARSKVVRALQGLLQTPPDESFIQVAKDAARVELVDPNDNLWVARPQRTDPLSDIVLGLFIADFLSNRTLYEQNLCVCSTCGRLSFRARSMSRTACREHNDPSQYGNK
ncbi:MAG TPA: hypothetical protein PK156_14555 [Polyangium sp.]|nr:hypothetical protein [Polyangium sp.]